MVVPIPSWPSELSTQHRTWPLARTAQVFWALTVAATTALTSGTATGKERIRVNAG